MDKSISVRHFKGLVLSMVLIALLERIEESLNRYPLQLSSLYIVIPCQSLHAEEYYAVTCGDWSILRYMRHATRVFERIPRARLQDVQVEFELASIASLGTCLSWGDSSEACEALEEVLLTFPSYRILCQAPVFRCIAGRADFWSPTIKQAFWRTEKRGLLVIPHSELKLNPSYVRYTLLKARTAQLKLA